MVVTLNDRSDQKAKDYRFRLPFGPPSVWILQASNSRSGILKGEALARISPRVRSVLLVGIVSHIIEALLSRGVPKALRT